MLEFKNALEADVFKYPLRTFYINLNTIVFIKEVVKYFGFSAGICDDHPLSLDWQQRLSKTPRRSYVFVTQLVGKANTDSRKQMIDELAEQTSAQTNSSNLSLASSGVSSTSSMSSVEMLDVEPSTSKEEATVAKRGNVSENQQ